MLIAAFMFFGFLGITILILLIIYKIADCYLQGRCTKLPKEDYDVEEADEWDGWAEAKEQDTLLGTTLEQTTASVKSEYSSDGLKSGFVNDGLEEKDTLQLTPKTQKPSRPPNPITGMMQQAEKMAELNAAQPKPTRKTNNLGPITGMNNQARSFSEPNLLEPGNKSSSLAPYGGSVMNLGTGTRLPSGSNLQTGSRLHTEAQITVELEFKAAKVLFGTIKSVTNLKSLVDLQTRDICFHMKFNPSRKHRVITKWKYIDDQMQSVTFSTKATQMELEKNRLLIRIYGRKNTFDRGRCYGQVLIFLSKVENIRKQWVKRVMPRATVEFDEEIFYGPVENASKQPFQTTVSDEGEPASEDDLLSDVESEPPPVKIQHASQPAFVTPALQPVEVQPASYPVDIQAGSQIATVVDTSNRDSVPGEAVSDRDSFVSEQVLAAGV